MNREPLSQSTDNYSPRLMSMDCPQHSGELTHSTPALRSHKWQKLPWVMVSCWGAWENQGEAVWEGSSSACPRDDIIFILLFFSCVEITSKHAKGYCKSLLWEPKITKDMNIATMILPLCLSQKQQECCQGNLKSFNQNRPQHFWGEATPNSNYFNKWPSI